MEPIRLFDPMFISDDEWADRWINPKMSEIFKPDPDSHNEGEWDHECFRLWVDCENGMKYHFVIKSGPVEEFWQRDCDAWMETGQKDVKVDPIVSVPGRKTKQNVNRFISASLVKLARELKKSEDEFLKAILENLGTGFKFRHSADIAVSKDGPDEYSWST